MRESKSTPWGSAFAMPEMSTTSILPARIDLAVSRRAPGSAPRPRLALPAAQTQTSRLRHVGTCPSASTPHQGPLFPQAQPRASITTVCKDRHLDRNLPATSGTRFVSTFNGVNDHPGDVVLAKFRTDQQVIQVRIVPIAPEIHPDVVGALRSEERRVGKECRYRSSPYD